MKLRTGYFLQGYSRRQRKWINVGCYFFTSLKEAKKFHKENGLKYYKTKFRIIKTTHKIIYAPPR